MKKKHAKPAGEQLTQDDIKQIAKATARDSMHSVEDTEEMVNFTCKWSGGSDPIFLEEIAAFSKSLKARRDVPCSLFGCLSKVNDASKTRYIAMCVKAALSAPDKYAKNNVSTLLTSTDIASITGSKSEVAVVAMDISKDAQSMCDAHKVAKVISTRLVGKAEAAMVRHNHNKGHGPNAPKYNNLKAIGNEFFHDLQDFLGVAVLASTKNPWKIADAPARALPKAKGSQACVLRELTVDGGVTLTTVKDSGFKVGSCVRKAHDKRPDASTYTIKKLSDTGVELSELNTKGTSNVPLSSFIDEFQLAERQTEKFVAASDAADPMELDEPKTELWKSLLRVALYKLWGEESVEVRMRVQPSRACFSLKTYAVGTLNLVPMTTTIMVGVVETVADSCGDCGVLFKNLKKQEVRGILKPRLEVSEPTKTLMVPCWFVRPAPDTSLANMEWAFRKVTMPEGFAQSYIKIPVLRNTKVVHEGA